MAFKQLDPETWRRQATRVLIAGGPNVGKTTCLKTFPHDKTGFLHVLSFPGEKGAASIPQGEYIKAYVWEQDPSKKISASTVIKQVRDLTIEILSGKHGPCATFAGDGIHKLMDYVLDDVTGGNYMDGEEFEARLYKRSYNVLIDYLTLVSQSPVPHVVFTVWDGREPDRQKNPGEKASDIPAHIYPDLPGKMAKLIMGEFSVVVNMNARTSSDPSKSVQRFWQLVSDSTVWGCGVKGPEELTSKLPKFIKPDWRELEKVLFGEKTSK